MYFHLIWIKEKNWKQYELDFLIGWWDEDFIRKFLAVQWVVVVSIRPFKDDPNSFWNVLVSLFFENTEIQITTSWEKLDDVISFFVSLEFAPRSVNFINNPIPDTEIQAMIKAATDKILEEEELLKKQKEEKKIKEQKKYSESAIDDTLKIINSELVYIEQIIKAWEWVISPMDKKKLEDLMNELKKIRLWTNFNKMVSLILYTHNLTKKMENDILVKYDSQKFLIDKNSVTTNIDFISELSHSRRISEKALLQPDRLTTQESIYNLLWSNSVFLRLLRKDLFYSFEKWSFNDFFCTTIQVLEHISLITIIIISLCWLIKPLWWLSNSSLYLLPITWWIGLLLFLFNSLKLKGTVSKIAWFVVLIAIYWIGMILLKWTFSL